MPLDRNRPSAFVRSREDAIDPGVDRVAVDEDVRESPAALLGQLDPTLHRARIGALGVVDNVRGAGALAVRADGRLPGTRAAAGADDDAVLAGRLTEALGVHGVRHFAGRIADRLVQPRSLLGRTIAVEQ